MSIRNDSRIPIAFAPAVAVAVAYWLPATALVSAPARRLLRVRATIDSTDAVALTFDDGPHRDGTPAVLERLAAASAAATFFLVGEQVERHPTLAAEIVARGHEVGVHCYRHRNLMRLTPRQVRDDLYRAADAIATATGVAPRVYRPPYGILTAPALAFARRSGWEVVLWRRDGADWEARATPRSIADRILRHAVAGDVLLLHDADHYSAPGSWQNCVAALERILETLEERGLGLAPL
jgi:peptidoglycan/xylan/chitin deacetylase (PgdA/CDA1 family)